MVERAGALQILRERAGMSRDEVGVLLGRPVERVAVIEGSDILRLRARTVAAYLHAVHAEVPVLVVRGADGALINLLDGSTVAG
jgi:hypothetical protein